MRATSARIFFLLVPLLFGFTAAALAGPVTGRVVDPDGRSVSGASVLLVQGTRVITRAVTDASGAFTLDAPDEGRFEVRIAADGFRAPPVSVTTGTATADVGAVALEISAVAESVVVSAAHVEIPLSTTASSVTVITGPELLARQTESVADALRLVPGLAVSSSGGRGALTGVFPRGGESDYSLVFIDGVQANAFGGGFDFAHLPVLNIERVEIVRGPQSALYGSNAIGSVIRVITRRGGPPSGLASFEGGSFGTTRLTAATAGSFTVWDWSGSVERLTTDNMTGDSAPAGELVVNDDYTRHLVSAAAGWSRTDGAGVRGDVRHLRDERGFPGPFGSNPAGFFGGIDPVSRGSNDRWLSSITATTPRRGRLHGHVQVAHGRIDGAVVDPFLESETWSRRTSVRAQADTNLTARLEGTLGGEYQRERAGSTFITARDAREVPVGRGVAGAFAELRWSRDARMFVAGGLRVERITREALAGNPDAFAGRPDFPVDTVISANPKLSAAWYLRPRDATFTKIRASAGTGIRPPDAFEITFTDNPSLKPERSRSVDAGVDHAFIGGRAMVEATAFLNRYDDLIVAVGSFSAASRYRTDNISNARARGLELAGSARTRLSVPAPMDLQVRAAYTRLHTEILAVDRESGAPPPFSPGDRLLRRPKHQFALDVFLQAGRLSSYLQGGGRGHVRDVEPSTGTFGGIFESPGYSVWSAGLSWRLHRRAELFGRVNNLLDRHYEEVLGYPALGRGVFAGIRIAAGL